MRPELLDFLDTSDSFEVRGMRILLEYFYANERFRKFYTSNIHGISVFGSARVKPGDHVYENAKKIGKLLYQSNYAVITGASSGVMEAANCGVSDGILEKLNKSKGYKVDLAEDSEEYHLELEKYSIGLKITLPYEKEVNSFLGSWVSFHYFAIRKLYFAMMSEGFIRLDGGWGTRDEFWEVATLVQTGKAPLMPIVVLSDESDILKEEIRRSIEKGYISDEDIHLIDIVENPHDAVRILNEFYKYLRRVHYTRDWDIELHIRKPIPKKHRDWMINYLRAHPGVFGEILFSGELVLVRGYTFRSFGHLRKLVNALNGTEEF